MHSVTRSKVNKKLAVVSKPERLFLSSGEALSPGGVRQGSCLGQDHRKCQKVSQAARGAAPDLGHDPHRRPDRVEIGWAEFGRLWPRRGPQRRDTGRLSGEQPWADSEEGCLQDPGPRPDLVERQRGLPDRLEKPHLRGWLRRSHRTDIPRANHPATRCGH